MKPYSNYKLENQNQNRKYSNQLKNRFISHAWRNFGAMSKRERERILQRRQRQQLFPATPLVRGSSGFKLRKQRREGRKERREEGGEKQECWRLEIVAARRQLASIGDWDIVIILSCLQPNVLVFTILVAKFAAI